MTVPPEARPGGAHPGDLTLLRVMRRPRWIIALLGALAVAAIFAGLGRWQFERAIGSGNATPTITEKAVPLTSVLKPGSGAGSTAGIGQLVVVTVQFQAGDYAIISGRENNNSTRGYWLVAHAVVLSPEEVSGGASGSTALPAHPDALAVARGYTTSKAQAQKQLRILNAQKAQEAMITGRVLPAEPPQQPQDNESGNPPRIEDMSVATLINLWKAPGTDESNFYSAYLVAKTDIPVGLSAIYSPPPLQQAAIDWLNAFYAVEWVVFAGFAVYLWYRLTKDAYERELDDLLEAREAEESAADESAADESVTGKAVAGERERSRDETGGSRVDPEDSEALHSEQLRGSVTVEEQGTQSAPSDKKVE